MYIEKGISVTDGESDPSHDMAPVRVEVGGAVSTAHPHTDVTGINMAPGSRAAEQPCSMFYNVVSRSRQVKASHHYGHFKGKTQLRIKISCLEQSICTRLT